MKSYRGSICKINKNIAALGILQWLSSKRIHLQGRRCQDMGLIPGSGRFPGKGNGNPLQYSCLGNPMEREAWRATVHGVTKESDITEQLNKTTRNTKGSSSDESKINPEVFRIYCCKNNRNCKHLDK